jgi:hypothetical protein
VAAAVVAILGGLPGLYLSWAAYRDAAGGEGLSLAKVADELAVAVGAQWNAEAGVRRLNDPYPLPVRWVAAAKCLVDSWDVLVRLATSGAGWPSHQRQGTWAAGPDDLAGDGGDLADVLARVPTGRLVVLGEPGSGKSMLMVRLVLDLLARRVSGGPVPVLASLASWNPAGQGLHGWLAAQMMIDHPALAAPAGPGAAGTRIEALLAAGLILPIVDGLDEIHDAVRGPALSRINDALRPGQRLVVTCRTEQYRDAVRPQAGAEVTLRAAAAVQLCPLDASVVSGYLRDDAAGPAAAARWGPVLASLGTQAPVALALTTPLMVGLARAVYNPRPGEHAGTLPDPAALCEFPDEAAIKSHLFDAFIPAAYRAVGRGRWPAHKAERWLVFLARHLEYKTSPDLGWWRLHRAVPVVVFGVAVIVASAVAVALALVLSGGLGLSLAGGLVVGLVFGLASVFAAAYRALPEASRRATWRLGTGGLAPGLLLGLAGAVAAGLSAGSGYTENLLPLRLGWAGVVVTGAAVAFRNPPQSSRGKRWRLGISWLATGFVLGLAGGLGTLIGEFPAETVQNALSQSPADAGLSAGFTTGLLISGGLAGVLAAGVAVARRRSAKSSRERWRPAISWLAPGLVLGLVPGLVLEFVLGLLLFLYVPQFNAAAVLVHPVLAVGLPGMLGVGLALARRRRPEPSRGVRWRPSISGLATTLTIGLACFGLGLLAGPASGVDAGLAALLVFGFASGLEGVPRDLNAAASHRSVLVHDRRAALVNGLAGLLTVGLAAGIAIGITGGGSGYTFSTAPAERLAAGLDFGLTAGIVAGIVFGLTSSMLNTAWPSYQLARGWLAAGRRLPWSLMSFLDDAHQRGVLRQDGAVYQFRHIELQHRLASRPRSLRAVE